MQYAFASWSDGGAINHAIDVTATPATYTANFQAQYQLTTAPFPEPAGVVTPSTGFAAGSTVTVAYTPNSPHVFTAWSGSSSGIANSLSLTIDEPLSIIANFDVPGFTCSIVSRAATPTVADVWQMIAESLGLASAVDDLNRDGIVNIADVQKVVEAARNLGCLY
ncbi:MAG TPA: hypothetical protein VMB03_19820 [Bryobacteraceae bacterium]|nr:hypothetical protein [Bryobacteraceae bacterium]